MRGFITLSHILKGGKNDLTRKLQFLLPSLSNGVSFIFSYFAYFTLIFRYCREKKEVSSSLEIPVTSRTVNTEMQSDTRATTAASEFRLPMINVGGSLSATDRDNYFGDQARNTFFDYYRQLARQRYTVGNGTEDKHDVRREEIIENELEQMRSARRETLDTEEEVRSYSPEPSPSLNLEETRQKPSTKPSQLPVVPAVERISYAKKLSMLTTDNIITPTTVEEDSMATSPPKSTGRRTPNTNTTRSMMKNSNTNSTASINMKQWSKTVNFDRPSQSSTEPSARSNHLGSEIHTQQTGRKVAVMEALGSGASFLAAKHYK